MSTYLGEAATVASSMPLSANLPQETKLQNELSHVIAIEVLTCFGH
jgi:hypothetical protein